MFKKYTKEDDSKFVIAKFLPKEFNFEGIDKEIILKINVSVIDIP